MSHKRPFSVLSSHQTATNEIEVEKALVNSVGKSSNQLFAKQKMRPNEYDELSKTFTNGTIAVTPFQKCPSSEDRLKHFSAWIQHLDEAHLKLEQESVGILNLHMMLNCAVIPLVYLQLLYMVKQYALNQAINMKNSLLYYWETESVYFNKDNECSSLEFIVKKILFRNAKIQSTLFTTEILFSQLQHRMETKSHIN